MGIKIRKGLCGWHRKKVLVEGPELKRLLKWVQRRGKSLECK